MKNLILIFAALIGALSSHSQSLNSDNFIDVYEGRWFELKSPISFRDFMLESKSIFRLTPKDSLVQLKDENIGNGWRRISFQQFNNGFEVMGAIGFFYLKGNQLYRYHIDFIPELVIKKDIRIDEKNARETVVSYLGFDNYKFQQSSNENRNYRLVIVNSEVEKSFWSSKFELSYEFEIINDSLSEAYRVYVSPDNGRIISKKSLIVKCTNTNANTVFNGNRNFYTTYYSTSNKYFLWDDCSSSFYSARITTQLKSGNSVFGYSSSNNTWTGNESGVQTHWGIYKALNYWGDIWGRNSLDNSGLDIYVYNRVNYDNAYYDGANKSFTFGDNNSSNSSDDFNTVDIIGHEFTHGIINHTANLTYEKESGALNESFADIFGEALERYTFGTGGYDFECGRERGTIRKLYDPKFANQPNTYGATGNGKYWVNTVGCTPSASNDFCGVHTNSGVHNYWFYLLASGGSGTNDNGYSYNISGIKFNDAISIAYKNLTAYLTPNSVYGDARIGSIWAADQLFGSSSTQKNTVIEAWCAVGMGNTCGGSSASPDLATNSASVSQNGNNVNVDLNIINNGATTSTSFEISYYLSLNSNFNTQDYLIGSQNINGLASGNKIQKTLNIDPCTISVPSGTYYVGYVIDSKNSVNESNENNNISYSPSSIILNCGGGGSNPTADFTVNKQSGLVSDVFVFTDLTSNNPNLWIWSISGPGAVSFLNGTNIYSKNPQMSFSSNGCYDITLYASNSFGNDTKVKKCYINIGVSGSAPIADFDPDMTIGTTSTVFTFNDKSSNNPTQWSWQFSGPGSVIFINGTNSNSQNPKIQFNMDGCYDVTLYVVNQSGNDTKVKKCIVNIGNGGNSLDPIAEFTLMGSNQIDRGNIVSFINQSIYSTNYLWSVTTNPNNLSYSFSNGSGMTSLNPTIQFNDPGCYNISLTAYNGAKNNSKTKNCFITVRQSAGVKSLEEFQKRVLVFPNPAQYQIRMVLPEDAATSAVVVISDLQGREVLRTNVVAQQADINISSLQTGVYILRATDSSGNIYLGKMVKE